MTFHVRHGGVPAAILAWARLARYPRRMILAGVVSCS